jgi:pyruvate dehydrogenase E2 component (dihydrolipoamide acetyltransferase)
VDPVSDIRKVVMPKWGLSMSSGKITEWIAAEGDQISGGDDLVEIDTDKIAGALEASDEGVLRRVIAQAGEDVPVGATIALIAPASVPDSEIDAAAQKARDELDSGAVEAVAGPVTGSVPVDGRTIAYATLGDSGEHIVLVHGYGGDKNSWLFVQEPLSDGHIVHALDLPGHGESTKDVGDGSIDVLAAAVIGFLDAKGIERAHLVGHSMGGAVVTAAASRAASLTLIAPAGVGPEINSSYLQGFADAKSRRELKPHLAALFADPALATRQLADDLMKYKRLDGVDAALHRLVDTLLTLEVSLSSVDVPVTAVWGRADAVVPASNASAFGDRVRIVDGAGHMVHLEQPGAVVAAVKGSVEAGSARH